MCTRDSHQAAVADDGKWFEMKPIGRQYVPADLSGQGDEYTLELRNCTCRSTLARKVPVLDSDRDELAIKLLGAPL